MYLTKKSLRKIAIIVGCYLVLGGISIVLAFVFSALLQAPDKTLLILGIVLNGLALLVGIVGRYGEGKGKLIGCGNKLVMQQLKPAEFLEKYQQTITQPDLVVCQPDFQVLYLVTIAYDLLGQQENALATADQMIEIAKEKKKSFAQLAKTSLLFSYGKVEEAEALFTAVQSKKLGVLEKEMAMIITKSDRAMAMGDYALAKPYFLQKLSTKFPKPDLVTLLVTHYYLGEIFAKEQAFQQAAEHFTYCVEQGGQTAIRTVAQEKLQEEMKLFSQEKLISLAREAVSGLQESSAGFPMPQVTVLRTVSGRIYITQNDLTGIVCQQLQEADDSQVELLVTLWKNGQIDLPSLAFRKALAVLHEENNKANIVLQGQGGLHLRLLKDTIKE